jgi:hypothetical protein
VASKAARETERSTMVDRKSAADFVTQATDLFKCHSPTLLAGRNVFFTYIPRKFVRDIHKIEKSEKELDMVTNVAECIWIALMSFNMTGIRNHVPSF